MPLSPASLDHLSVRMNSILSINERTRSDMASCIQSDRKSFYLSYWANPVNEQGMLYAEPGEEVILPRATQEGHRICVREFDFGVI